MLRKRQVNREIKKEVQNRLAILSMIAISLLSQSVISNAFQNEPDGFRGIKWGTDIKDLPDMKFISEEGDEKIYVRENEKLTIGEADLAKIEYYFYKNKFWSVIISFKGNSNFNKIKETLFYNYGKGIDSSYASNYYFWGSSEVMIAIKYDDIYDFGQIGYFYLPIKKEKESDLKEKAKQGVDDL